MQNQKELKELANRHMPNLVDAYNKAFERMKGILPLMGASYARTKATLLHDLVNQEVKAIYPAGTPDCKIISVHESATLLIMNKLAFCGLAVVLMPPNRCYMKCRLI